MATTRTWVVTVAALVFACGGATATVPGDGNSGGSGAQGGSAGNAGSAGAGGSGVGGSGVGGAGGSSGGGAGGAGGDAIRLGCPATLPAQGEPCAPLNLACEYGEDSNIECNVVARCIGGSFQIDPPPPGPSCPTPMGEPGCPKSYGDIKDGASCNPTGLTCGYPDGRCVCEDYRGGPPCFADGGAICPPSWHCDRPQAGCPIPRPRVGSMCGPNSPSFCDYGACSLPGGLALSCTDGSWQPVPVGCPAQGGGH